MWSSARSLKKTLNQPSLVSNFDFLGINSSVAYWKHLPLVPVNKLQKYLKLVSQKLGTLQFLNPNELGFQVQKLIVTNLKVRKKNPYPCFGLCSPEPPKNDIFYIFQWILAPYLNPKLGTNLPAMAIFHMNYTKIFLEDMTAFAVVCLPDSLP